MRLTQNQVEIITDTVTDILGNDADVFVFGSRLDEGAKGGDVDILVESRAPISRLEQAKLQNILEARLGLPVDIVIQERDAKPTPFMVIARAHAQRLVHRI